MKHLLAQRLLRVCTAVTITQRIAVTLNRWLPLPQDQHPLRSLVRPAYMQTNDTQPKLDWAGVNVGLGLRIQVFGGARQVLFLFK